MANSQFSLFMEKVKTDDALRRRILDAEKLAAYNTLKLKQDIDAVSEANFSAIKKIAEEAGYDITLDVSRPEKTQVTPNAREIENLKCVFTCCLVFTSAFAIEGPNS